MRPLGFNLGTGSCGGFEGQVAGTGTLGGFNGQVGWVWEQAWWIRTRESRPSGLNLGTQDLGHGFGYLEGLLVDFGPEGGSPGNVYLRALSMSLRVYASMSRSVSICSYSAMYLLCVCACHFSAFQAIHFPVLEAIHFPALQANPRPSVEGGGLENPDVQMGKNTSY